MMAYIFQYEQIVIQNGKLDLKHFGIQFDYSRKVFIGGLPLDVTEGRLLVFVDRIRSLYLNFETNRTYFVLSKRDSNIQ